MENTSKHLYHISDLKDYKVSDGYKDVRNWPVRDRDNRIIGKVDNLLVNLDAQKVMYLDVNVDNSIIEKNYDPYRSTTTNEIREFINKEGDTHVIIPIGLVDINSEDKFVYTETLDHNAFAETKRHNPDRNISRDYEVAVLDSYGRTIDTRRVNLLEDNPNRIEIVVKTESVKEEYSNPDRHKHYRNDNISDAQIVVDDTNDPHLNKEPLYDKESRDEFYKRRYFDDRNFRR